MTGEAENADWHVHFRQAFSSFQINNLSVIELEFDTEQAVVKLDCNFVGKVEGSAESLHFVGTGELRLLFKWDFWCIDMLSLPKSVVC